MGGVIQGLLELRTTSKALGASCHLLRIDRNLARLSRLLHVEVLLSVVSVVVEVPERLRLLACGVLALPELA